jgi:GDP-mannose transporter
LHPAGFHIKAYTWLCVWVAFFLFEACYVKHVCDTVAMSNWGRVYYTNFLAAMALLVVFPMCTGEHEVLRAAAFSLPQVSVLFMSCAVGVCMSHAGGLRVAVAGCYGAMPDPDVNLWSGNIQELRQCSGGCRQAKRRA